MGEELELGNLFVVCDDGTYVPFEGIKPIDIVSVNEMDEELYSSLPKEGTIELRDQWEIPKEGTIELRDQWEIPKEGTIELISNIKHRDYRKSMKAFKAQINRYRRCKRYAARLKEYARRRALKGIRYT